MNRRRYALLLLVAALVVVPSASVFGQSAGAPVPIPDEYRTEVSRVEERGRVIFQGEQFAANAARVLIRETNAGEDRRLVGWVTVIRNGDPLARYIGRVGGEYVVLYDVRLTADSEWVPTANDPPLPPEPDELVQFRAFNTAVAAVPFRCAAQYNHVILPADDGDGFSVYLLPGMRDSNLVPFGGHFRVEVSADGQVAEEVAPFSTGCLELDRGQADANLGEGDVPEALMVTHVLGHVPTEIHVMLSLRQSHPILVGTPGGAWLVNAGSVSYGGPLPAREARSE